ncbi:MAG: LON peptidase substrate-binding domain-containing protein [Pseudomonadota bacterium]
MQLPLFPLNVVLYPGGPLPLRIFESRYIDMIGERMRNDGPFGVLLIREGQEAGGTAATWDVGTLAKISDFYQGSDGLLGVTAIGGRRFRLLSAERAADGLNIGHVELLPDEPALPLPRDYEPLAEILAGVLEDLGKLYENLPRELDNAGWVANRFLEILPIRLEEKQRLLENNEPLERLKLVREVLNSAQPAQ